jgi:hypothetical protein
MYKKYSITELGEDYKYIAKIDFHLKIWTGPLKQNNTGSQLLQKKVESEIAPCFLLHCLTAAFLFLPPTLLLAPRRHLLVPFAPCRLLARPPMPARPGCRRPLARPLQPLARPPSPSWPGGVACFPGHRHSLASRRIPLDFVQER